MLRDVNIAIATKIIHNIVRAYFGFIKKYNYAHKACRGVVDSLQRKRTLI